MGKLVFDDWLLRNQKAYRSRCNTYKFILAFMLILLVFSLVLTLIYWYLVVFFLLFLLTFVVVIFEWLKIKNHHLKIYENTICITDRFGREKTYPIEIVSCTLVLKRAVNRSGGIWLLFYDKNQNRICRYEDMLNHGAPYGAPPTDWERALMDLQIPIVDEGYILKNR